MSTFTLPTMTTTATSGMSYPAYPMIDLSNKSIKERYSEDLFNKLNSAHKYLKVSMSKPKEGTPVPIASGTVSIINASAAINKVDLNKASYFLPRFRIAGTGNDLTQYMMNQPVINNMYGGDSTAINAAINNESYNNNSINEPGDARTKFEEEILNAKDYKNQLLEKVFEDLIIRSVKGSKVVGASSKSDSGKRGKRTKMADFAMKYLEFITNKNKAIEAKIPDPYPDYFDVSKMNTEGAGWEMPKYNSSKNKYYYPDNKYFLVAGSIQQLMAAVSVLVAYAQTSSEGAGINAYAQEIANAIPTFVNSAGERIPQSAPVRQK